MIHSDVKEKGLFHMDGTLSEVSAECVLILKHLYLKIKEEFGQELAGSILINMILKAIDETLDKEAIAQWREQMQKEQEEVEQQDEVPVTQ